MEVALVEAQRQAAEIDDTNRALDSKAGIIFGFSSVVIIELLLWRIGNIPKSGLEIVFVIGVLGFLATTLWATSALFLRLADVGSHPSVLLDEFLEHEVAERNQYAMVSLTEDLGFMRELEIQANREKAAFVRNATIFMLWSIFVIAAFALAEVA